MLAQLSGERPQRAGRARTRGEQRLPERVHEIALVAQDATGIAARQGCGGEQPGDGGEDEHRGIRRPRMLQPEQC